MPRQMNYQPISWFWDLYSREKIDMDPPYQRRSVWNQEYKDFFIDTVLSNFPAPAIFLHQDVDENGNTKFSVIDGKQRLSTIFEFVNGDFPVYDNATTSRNRGKYFKDLDQETKKEFWKYQFSIEYIDSTEESVINAIFDRINRNVAKLTPQELRHAKFDGRFITISEEYASMMESLLNKSFPNLSTQSRKQMKDVEFVAQLLLYIEEGPKSYTQETLDAAFSSRDVEWIQEEEVKEKFIHTISFIKSIYDVENSIARTRFRNQADFYSLFAAIADIYEATENFDMDKLNQDLISFAASVEDYDMRQADQRLADYYNAARSASNDPSSRRIRINTVKEIINNARSN